MTASWNHRNDSNRSRVAPGFRIGRKGSGLPRGFSVNGQSPALGSGLPLSGKPTYFGSPIMQSHPAESSVLLTRREELGLSSVALAERRGESEEGCARAANRPQRSAQSENKLSN